MAGDPNFTAAFSPSTIAPGASSTLTFTIDNTSNDTALSEAAFSATLPAGVSISASPNATTDCHSAQISAPGGGTSISLSGGRIGTGVSCTYSLVVTSTTVGTHSLTTGTLTSGAGSHTTANADITVSSSLPSLSLSASPVSVSPGDITTLTYTIDNSHSGSNATFVDFTHLLNNGFELATSPEFSHNCPLRTISTFVLGSFAISTSGQSVTANDVEVNAGASCTATVNVKAPAEIGSYHLETGTLSSSAGTSGPASTLVAVENSITNGSVMAASFSEEASPGETITLDFELVNIDRENNIDGLNFTADLNATLSGLVATVLPSSGFCGAGSTISGSSNLSVTNVSLASEDTCTFSVTVLVPSNAAAGDYTFTSSTINLTRGVATTSTAASATLRVRKAPLLSMQFLSSSVAPEEDVTLRFNVTNTDSANPVSDITFSVLTTDGLAGFVAKTLPTANYCGSGSSSSTISESSGTITGFSMNSGSLSAGANCTFDVVLTVPDNAQSGTYSFSSSSGTATVSGTSLGIGEASTQLSVVAAPSMSFSVAEGNVVPGGTITLNFSLNYSENATADATNVGFTVNLDTALAGLAAVSSAQNDVCGSGSSISGTSNLSATGITMSAGESCNITVTALVPSSAGAGSVTISTSIVNATVSSSNVTSASVSGNFAVTGLSISHQFLSDPALPSSDVVIRYTISNDANASAATAIQFSHDLSAIISGTVVNGALPSTPCNGSSTVTGTTNLSFSGGELQTGSNCSFDVTVAIPANTDGIYNSSTSQGSATVNSANTTFSASSTFLNVVPLTVLLSTSESSPTSSSDIPLFISFSRDVVNFIESDLSVSNGTISNLAGSGSNYSATLSPSADGTVTVDLPANVVDDAVDGSVKNPAATQLSIVYESSPEIPTPSLVIGSPSTGIVNSGPVTFDITYSNSEQTSLTPTSIALNATGDASATITVTDGTTNSPVVNLTNIAGDGTLGISIEAGTARNGDRQAGSAGPSPTFSVDNTAPTVSIVDFVANPYNSSFPVTVTFSEDVTGFTIDDLTFTNASLSNFSANSASVYTVTVSPSNDGDVTGNLAENSAQDSAGNGNTAAPGYGMVYDATKPTVTISSPSTDVNAAFITTFTFSETVTGFGSGDISVNNGTVSNFNQNSGAVYTATITPTTEGQVTIDVAADAGTDSAGNSSSAATQYSVNYDTTAPGLSLSAQDSLAQGNTIVTFTFTEAVSGFTVNDISIGNGSASNFSSTSASVYTAAIAASTDGAVTVDVPSAIATDSAGNNNSAATQLSFTSDSTSPVLSSTTPMDDAIGVAYNSNLILTFSENVQLNSASAGSLLVYELSPNGNIVDTLTFSVSAGNLTGPGTASFSVNSLTIELDSDLKVGTYYAVQVSSGLLQDTAGNNFTGISNNTTWNFVTLPGIRLSSDQSNLTEESAEQATVTLALTDAQNQPFTTPADVTLAMSFAGSTATENSDYSINGLTSNSLTISANASSSSFTVTAVSDSVADDNETVAIAVESVTTNNASEITPQAISIAIVENAVPSITGVPASTSLSEDVKGQVDFSEVVIADAEDDTLTLTVSMNTGRVVSPKGSADNVTVTPLGPTSIRLSGQAAALTNYLDFPDAIAILPPKNHVSAMILSLLLSDGTEQADTQNIAVNITSVNDAPRLITGTIAEFDMTDGSIGSALVYTETVDSRTMNVTLDTGNWVNSDLDTFGGSTEEALYSNADSATSLVTVSFDQKVNLESLVYFFKVGSAPQSLTLTPTGQRGETITLSSSDFTADDAGALVDLRGWLGITSFTITSSSGHFAPGLDSIVFSLPPTDFSFQEDQPGNLDLSSLSLSDEDSASLILKISTDSGTLSLPAGRPASNFTAVPSNVSVSISNNVITLSGTIAEINTYLSGSTNIQYAPSSDQSGSDLATITITVNDNDGSGDVELQSISVDVTAVNDAPVISNLDGDTVSFVQNGGVVLIDASSNAVATDVDDGNLDGGSLTVAITAGGASTEDLLSVSNTVTLASLNSGANVTVDNTVIGTLGSAVSEGNDFIVNFNSKATLSRVSSLLNALTYNNTNSNSPTEGNRTIGITLNDGEDDSSVAQITLSFTALDLDSTITFFSINGNLEVTNNTTSNAASYYTLRLKDSGDDGVDTTINSIAFDVTGTMDVSSVSFLLTYATSSNTLGETQSGAYNNGVVTFSSPIVVANGETSGVLTLNVFLNQTSELVDNSTLIVSVDPTQDIQVANYSSGIGSTGVLSTSNFPLTLDISATELVFSTEPAGSVSGLALTNQPVLRAQDTYGNLDTDFDNQVSLSESSDGTLTGNSTMASGGIATFSNLVYTATEDNESFVLQAAVSLDSRTSMQPASSQVISDVVATRVSFQTEPSPVAINAKTSTDFTTVPVLAAVDAQGLVDEDYNGSVVLSETNGQGTAQLSADNDSDFDIATVTLNFNAGLAAADGLNVTYTVSDSGNETFNLLATSGNLSSATSTSISVNDLPSLEGTPVEISVVEDQRSNLDLTGMVLSDSENDELTLTFNVTKGTLFIASGDGSHNNVTISGDESRTLKLMGDVADLTTLLSSPSELSYLSAHNDDSDDTLTIVANDGLVDGAASNISLAIIPVNDQPTISGIAVDTVEQGGQYSFTPVSFDVDGDALSFSIQNQPEWTVFDDTSGELSGIPGNDNVGIYNDVQISVSDGTYSANLTGFSITVTNVNDAPAISGLPATQVNEDENYSFTPSALDIDGDSLTFSILNLPAWANFNINTGNLAGVPGNDDVGTYSGIVISVTDGLETISLPSFGIIVSPVNDAPAISGTPATRVIQGSRYEFNPEVSDVDSNSFTWSIVNSPEWAAFDTTTGVLTGTPSSSDVGIFSNIVITVSDGQLADSLAAFSIEVTEINDAPSISGNPTTVAIENQSYQFVPSATDPNGDSLTFMIANQPGWLAFDTQTGVLSGVPGNGDVGEYPGIVISVSDGELSASLPAFVIEVINANSAPVADNQTVSVAEDASVGIILEASDADGDSVTFSIIESVSYGTILLDGNTATYVPNQDVSGITDSFSYVANDGESDSNIANVTINVTPVNDAPEISGIPLGRVKVLKGYNFEPQASDIDSEVLTFSIENRPNWTAFDVSTGNLSGTPSSEDAGIYGGIIVKVSDGELSAELAPFEIEVLVNSAPEILGAPKVVAPVGEAYSFVPEALDQDGDDLRFSISNLPSWASFDVLSGALSGSPGPANIGTFPGIIVSVTDGLNTVSLPTFSIRVCEICDNMPPEISGTPETTVTTGNSYEFIPVASDENDDTLLFSVANAPGWLSFDPLTGRLSGTPLQSDVGVYRNIVISVSDGQDSVSLASFSVEVLSFNSAPTISGSPITSVANGEQYSFTPSVSDADGDDLVFSVVNKPSWASFNPNSGRLRGTPGTDDVGVFSEIEIKVTDNVNDSVALPKFSIEVIAQNSAPVISGRPRTTVTQGKVYRFSPSASDADGDLLLFSVVNLPGWLSFDEQTGVLNGTPLQEDIGEYADIQVSASDGTDQTDLPSFSIRVVNSNTAPVATSSEVSTKEDNSVTIKANATDENQDDLTFTIVNPPSNGTISADNNGWVYSPSADFNGVDAFDFSVSDGELTSELATVTINVGAVNDKPDAINDEITLDQVESGVYTLDVLVNDIDPDITTNADELTLQRVSTTLGTAQVVDNQIQVALGASFIGTVKLTYSIRDIEAKNDTARVSLTINGVEDINAPVITVPEDIVADATGLITRVNPGTASAVDAEGNLLPVSLVDDDLDFAPGVHTLYWQTEDSYGTPSTAEQLITILPIISLSSIDTTAEGSTFEVQFLLNGEAPFYPYMVNYTLSGTAEGNGVDYSSMGTGTVVFTEGQSAQASFEVHLDGDIEANETIIISLNNDQNTGANHSAIVTISEDNIAPSISLSVLQDDIPTFVVAKDAGATTIVADVSDPNPQNTLSFDWTADDISNMSTVDERFEFNAAQMEIGRYEVSLYVNDDGDPILDATESVVFEVVESLNVLSETDDTDGDLIPDAQEGYGDSDGDGIPDYLDAIDDCNVIASQVGNQSEFLVESEPGVCMRLGETASANDSNGVQVVVDDIAQRQSRINQHGERVELLANNLPEDRNYENVGGVFDFVLYDLQKIGQVVRVVLPQSQPIPENAVYRKYNAKTELWRAFVSNDNNAVFSAAGTEGNCPPPGASNYKAGLTAGHWCVQLLISDGGPNDQDGVANAAISDPGGVAVFISDNTKPIAVDDSVQLAWNSDIEIDVLQNDSDADGDDLIIRSAQAKIGDVEITSTGLLYTAKIGFAGRDMVNYIIGDGNGGRANAVVTIQIKGNRAPGAFDDFAETDNITAIEIDVLANDIDVDGDVLTVISATANSGRVFVLTNNLVKYVPEPSYSGLDTVIYEVTDSQGASDTAVVSVFVDGNENPVASDDSILTEFETSITVNVLANDSDPDGDTLFVLSAEAQYGNVQINDDYSLTYTPATSFSGEDIITYSVSDGVLTSTAIVRVTVAEEQIEVVDVISRSGGGTVNLILLFLLFITVMWRCSHGLVRKK
ncbi:tandem-95 repeat protein [Planctobacterium marinum]|uniref:tandem-95 repeat protein n=1 Tax=Planctobacterium marinum TaxID=1631968 RepID=UPI001E5B1BF0|nr:tandem-95 repeat protein [Planctobacterium marinum]MCC2606111.1 tandem-95 repeat protein [Planctobacterium marinum]